MKGIHLIYDDEEKEKIKIDNLTNKEKVKYTGRGEVRQVLREDVLKMITAVTKEQPNPPKLGNPFHLDKKEETCFTWAKKKLEICDIKLEMGFTDWVVSVTSLYTPHPPGSGRYDKITKTLDCNIL